MDFNIGDILSKIKIPLSTERKVALTVKKYLESKGVPIGKELKISFSGDILLVKTTTHIKNYILLNQNSILLELKQSIPNLKEIKSIR